MKIRDYEVKTIATKAFCDECGEELVYDESSILLTYPPQFKYRCSKCGKCETSFTKYPSISYRIIEEVKSNDKQNS